MLREEYRVRMFEKRLLKSLALRGRIVRHKILHSEPS